MPPPVHVAPDRQSVHETIFRAMSQRRRLSLRYCDCDGGPAVATKARLISPGAKSEPVVPDRAFLGRPPGASLSKSPGSSVSS